MKKNVWIIFAVTALTAVAALAQDPVSAPDASAKSQKKKATSIKSRVEINPAATATVKGEGINVRGQPSFIGEVLGHLQNGATVSVLEEITLNHPPAGEPPKWYKIAMPTNIPVWLKTDYIDAATKSVSVRRVNLRGGPGENYSIVGRLDKGAVLTELREEKGWEAVDAPSNSYAFVAAEFLDMQAAAPPVIAAAAPAPEVVNVNSPAAPVAAEPPPASPPATNTPPTTAPEPAPVAAAPVAPAPTAQTETAAELAALHQAPAEPVVPRVVTREGFVHKSYNIQSPTDFELHDIKSGDLIEYLQPQGQQNFKIYVGTRVTVSGPEVMDQRWPRTPVLQVQTVELLP